MPVLFCKQLNLYTLLSQIQLDSVMGEFKEIPDPDLLFASEDEKTFSLESDLPSLPVPDLHHTLQRYLDSGGVLFHR